MAVLSTPLRIPLDEIGGGEVVQPYWTSSPRGRIYRKRGERLTRDEIMAMPAANRQAMLGKFIAVWPSTPNGDVASRRSGANAERAERHVVSLGHGQFHVIEGALLTAEPVTREEAYELAGRSPPADAKAAVKSRRTN